jgi:hypothetical protein
MSHANNPQALYGKQQLCNSCIQQLPCMQLHKHPPRRNDRHKGRAMQKLDSIRRGSKDLLAAIQSLKTELHDASGLGWVPETDRLLHIIMRQATPEEFEKAEEKVQTAAVKQGELEGNEFNHALIDCLEKMGQKHRDFEAMRAALLPNSKGSDRKPSPEFSGATVDGPGEKGSDRKTSAEFSGAAMDGKKNHHHGMMDGGGEKAAEKPAQAGGCTMCGGSHSRDAACPAEGAVCQLCNRIGHFALRCRTFSYQLREQRGDGGYPGRRSERSSNYRGRGGRGHGDRGARGGGQHRGGAGQQERHAGAAQTDSGDLHF